MFVAGDDLLETRLTGESLHDSQEIIKFSSWKRFTESCVGT